MSTPRSRRLTTRGLVSLAAAFGAALVSFALGPLWTLVVALASPSPAVAASIHSFWIPLSATAVQGAAGLLGFIGFLFLWRGRWEVGPDYASRIGLPMLAALIAGVSYVLFEVTGLLLGYVGGVQFLVPWHALFAVVGGVFLGLALYGVLGKLPIAGARPLAAVSLALGLLGIALVNLSAFGLRRLRTAGLEGAGLGLALASLTIWLVLCLWGEESLHGRVPDRPAAAVQPES